MSERRTEIVELFSSIQGEGLLVGLRQAFLRFHGCNLACSYCDTRHGEHPGTALLEATPGRRDFIPEPNPVALEKVVDTLNLWLRGWPGIHHSISITGGEPLINVEVLREWLPELQRLLPIYLETNGILYHVLEELIPNIDFISMDIKLPSSSGCTDLWEKHREFLQVASQKTVFIKMVICDATEDWEVTRASELIADIDPAISCILQPVTCNDGTVGIRPLRMLELQEIAAGLLADVRVIPQTHKFIGQL